MDLWKTFNLDFWELVLWLSLNINNKILHGKTCLRIRCLIHLISHLDSRVSLGMTLAWIAVIEELVALITTQVPMFITSLEGQPTTLILWEEATEIILLIIQEAGFRISLQNRFNLGSHHHSNNNHLGKTVSSHNKTKIPGQCHGMALPNNKDLNKLSQTRLIFPISSSQQQDNSQSQLTQEL